MPTIGSHSTIDSPEPVSRVTPPKITMANTSAQQVSNHQAMGRSCDSGTTVIMISGPEWAGYVSVSPQRAPMLMLLWTDSKSA